MSVKAILEVVGRLNAAWPAGRLEELLEIFDAGVVLVPSSGDEPRVAGRDAVIRGYEEFIDQAVIHRYEAEQPEVDLFDTTALALCPYTIDYEIAGRRWIGSGRELLLLHKGREGWRVVCRTLLAVDERDSQPE